MNPEMCDSSANQCQMLALPSWIVVKPPQCLLNVVELLFRLLECRFNTLDADIIVWFVVLSRLILSCAVVLNLFAAILDLCEAESSRGSLEEMTEGG
jgi:hypothetical protein